MIDPVKRRVLIEALQDYLLARFHSPEAKQAECDRMLRLAGVSWEDLLCAPTRTGASAAVREASEFARVIWQHRALAHPVELPCAVVWLDAAPIDASAIDKLCTMADAILERVRMPRTLLSDCLA